LLTNLPVLLNIKIREDIPIEKIELDLFKRKNIEVYLQRDDLLHKDVSGNKWRKLEYGLREYDRSKFDGILTFGGAFSNHLAATAAACQLLEIPLVAYIRGEKPIKLNDTLQFILNKGATLVWINREEYRELRTRNWPNPNVEIYNRYLVIPEGGQSEMAVKSCMDISKYWGNDYDYACCSIGTGTTFSGMVNGLKDRSTKSLGFVMLKDKHYLDDEILKMTLSSNYKLNRAYHFNGFAKVTDELIHFLNTFYKVTQIPLEPIYTGKMMYGICDLAEQDYFPKGSEIIAIHTGGLQGIPGFNARRRSKGKSVLEYELIIRSK